jgi:hypothetical protein
MRLFLFSQKEPHFFCKLSVYITNWIAISVERSSTALFFLIVRSLCDVK